MPNRSQALVAAGAAISPFDEPEFYRVVATQVGAHEDHDDASPPRTTPSTSMARERTSPSSRTRTSCLTASQPVLVADVQASQEAAGVVRGLPGGDPSLTFVRAGRAVAERLRPAHAGQVRVRLPGDHRAVRRAGLRRRPARRRQGLRDGSGRRPRREDAARRRTRRSSSTGASSPSRRSTRTRPSPINVLPGRQNDGVHRVQSDYPVGVLVYGFDAFVSYAYAGGTELRDINPN